MFVTFYVTGSIVNNSAIWGLFWDIEVSTESWGLEQFNLNDTLKLHILQHHLSEILESSEKKLRNESDEIVEEAHHKLKPFATDTITSQHPRKQDHGP